MENKISIKKIAIHHLQKPSDLTENCLFQFCLMYVCYMCLFKWIWGKISCTHFDNLPQITKSWLWHEILRKTMAAQMLDAIWTALLSQWSIDFGFQKIKHTFRDFLIYFHKISCDGITEQCYVVWSQLMREALHCF
jgi:hypothetical protein